MNQFVTRCVAIRFHLSWRHSDDLFVCFGVKPTQRAEDEISHETRSEGGKEGPRENRESGLTKQGGGGRSAWDSSPGEERLAEGGSERRQSKMG